MDHRPNIKASEAKLKAIGFPEEYREQLERKYGDRRQSQFTKERETVERYFDVVTSRLGGTYVIEKVLAVGGTGIVHVGRHSRFHQPIVLKINRPNIDIEEMSMVEREAKILPTLSHPNIITVLDLGEDAEIPDAPKLTYIVERFITGSKPLFTFDKERVEETWLARRLKELKGQMPAALRLAGDDDAGQATGLISSLLADVASVFSQWVSSLIHIHSQHASARSGYVYLDVKPENVLVDEHLHLTSIDYGSIQRVDTEDSSPIEVFFTERYAHPDLIKRIKDKASSNRVRGAVRRADLRPAFDSFSLGLSMLEVLNEIANVRPHVVPQLPLYRSLHFLATRLLDGRNSGRADDNHPYASQVFPSLRDSDYEHLGYSNLADAYRDLEKERGRWSLEDQVPELAAYSKDIVRVVPGFNTVLTPRLRGVIEHPLVGRLKYVSQLGLVSLVYPTADHSRYDHALGSYTYTTYYVKSLFNDLGNPLFRNLVGAEDINALLLASLLHDLGQYPLAHDLEEVHDRIFKHGRIGESLLEDPMLDQRGRTLLELIEDPKNGWNVEADTLRRVLGTHSKNQDPLEENQDTSLRKTDVLGAIVDGPVDADKADYIVRDSGRCELPYGSQLDLERLMRVLTVAMIPDESTPSRRVTLGVYDKGLASAHAFGQARYQLFSTVYWHHTSRILKTMLQYATAIGLPLEVFGAPTPKREDIELGIREQLLAFVKGLVPPFEIPDDSGNVSGDEVLPSLDLGAAPPEDALKSLGDEQGPENDGVLLGGEPHWYPGIAWTDWLMLQWIRRLPNAAPRSNSLISGIERRRLYKRIASFGRGDGQPGFVRPLDELAWPDRIRIADSLSEHIHDRLRRDWANLNTASNMTKSEFDTLYESQMFVLIDIPSPSKKIGYERPLGVVPELREKSYHQDTRQAFEDRGWRQITTAMFEGIAPIRVLCHPDVRNLVSALFAPVEGPIAKELTRLL